MKSTRLTPGLLFVAFLAFVWLLDIVPGWQRRGELTQLIKQQEDKLRSSTEKRGTMKAMGKESARLATAFGVLLDLPKKWDHSEHLVRVADKVCKEAGVQLISWQFVTPSIRGEFRRYPVTLNVDGDLKGMTKLLLALRNSRPLLDAERVSFRVSGESDGKIGGQLTVSTFARAPKEVKGKAKLRR